MCHHRQLAWLQPSAIPNSSAMAQSQQTKAGRKNFERHVCTSLPPWSPDKKSFSCDFGLDECMCSLGRSVFFCPETKFHTGMKWVKFQPRSITWSNFFQLQAPWCSHDRSTQKKIEAKFFFSQKILSKSFFVALQVSVGISRMSGWFQNKFSCGVQFHHDSDFISKVFISKNFIELRWPRTHALGKNENKTKNFTITLQKKTR